MASVQEARYVAVLSPLGEDVLLFRRMTGSEALGQLFRFDLDLLSDDHEIALDSLLGQNMAVRLTLPQGGERFFNGYVSHCSYEGAYGYHARYSVVLSPWLWFLTRTADCRIYQSKTTPEIVKSVFREHGLTDFEEALTGDYAPWEYCVQYRETDFNFVSRLLEDEGIYYFFKHDEDNHILVLADSYSAHDRIPDYEEIPYYPPGEAGRRERDHLTDWRVEGHVQPGIYSLNAFDFEKPRARLEVRSAVTRDHPFAQSEYYDYPGRYTDTGVGESRARTRIEERHVEYERVTARGNAEGVYAGGLFELTDYPREDQNREYLVLWIEYELRSQAYESESGTGGEELYGCLLGAMASDRPFRPARVTERPVVQGPQTATVVGKEGEEIWVDKYGRVKLQFHWDRYGKADENSSCWVRVAQAWAGKQWGSMFLPRLGQEVIVEFLEGDPDRPIVTGRVYNEVQRPPYELPNEKTKSTLKSNSSKGGQGFNELRFEDKAGEEQVFIHAQYDMDTVVRHDQSNTVDNNRTLKVVGDQQETVDGNVNTQVGGDRDESIGGDQSLTVTGDTTINCTGKVKIVGNGNVEIEGPSVSLTGITEIKLSVGASSIMLTPASLQVSAPTVTTNGTALNEVKGGVVDVKGGIVKVNS